MKLSSLSQHSVDMKGLLLLPLLLLGTVSALHLGKSFPPFLIHLSRFSPFPLRVLLLLGPGPQPPLFRGPSPSLVRFLLDPEV